MPFAEFMEACLYHPEHGYYTRGEQRNAQGKRGDYYTSVDVHAIFGRLLARQLAEMWEGMGRPGGFRAVECGAGEGRLAQQICEFAARALPEFNRALRYVAVERSAVRRAVCRSNLANVASAGKEGASQGGDAAWSEGPGAATAGGASARIEFVEELPQQIGAGCIFSNELLDALPVHRVVQQRDGLKEMFVDWQKGRFVDHVAGPSTARLAEYFGEQGITLDEGAQAEVCLAACEWIERAGRALERGYVLTIDYGHEARELYNHRRMRGTLLAYQQHGTSEEYYAQPGEQDLTAHVNLTALDLWGRRTGLRRAGLVSQSHFLLALGRTNEFADLYDQGMNETDRVRARLKLKSLIYPEGMGETFSVLVQQKNVSEGVKLAGLQPL